MIREMQSFENRVEMIREYGHNPDSVAANSFDKYGFDVFGVPGHVGESIADGDRLATMRVNFRWRDRKRATAAIVADTGTKAPIRHKEWITGYIAGATFSARHHSGRPHRDEKAEIWASAIDAARAVIARRPGSAYEADIDLLALANPYIESPDADVRP